MRRALLWLFRDLIAAIHASEGRVMAKLDELQSAEDAEGVAINRAIAQNAVNLQKLSDALSAGADATQLAALVSEAQDHAAKLTAAFPDPDSGTLDTSGTAKIDPEPVPQPQPAAPAAGS